MFKKQLDEGMAATTLACCCAAFSERRCKRGMVLAKGGSITPHNQVQGRSLHPDKIEERWAAIRHSQGIPSAILSAHDGM